MDVEAHNYFNAGLSAGQMKCIAGFNHHRQRNSTINKGLVESKYLRCQKNENWEHIVTYKAILIEDKKKFITKIGEEM